MLFQTFIHVTTTNIYLDPFLSTFIYLLAFLNSLPNLLRFVPFYLALGNKAQIKYSPEVLLNWQSWTDD